LISFETGKKEPNPKNNKTKEVRIGIKPIFPIIGIFWRI
jgi:hypothetical protein